MANITIKSIQFPYYKGDATKWQPISGWATVSQLINAIKDPKPETLDILLQIEQAAKVGDTETKNKLKQEHLPFFLPTVQSNGKSRGLKDITAFTGLMPLDFDGLDSPDYAAAFKEFLFNEYDSIITSWLSASKKGVRALVSIPVVLEIDEYRALFNGMALELETYKGFDPAPKNAVLPLFLSYDPELLIRDNYTTWTNAVTPVNSFDYTTVTPPPNIDVTDKDKNTVVKIITTTINNVSDPHHVELRSGCCSIGGYIATGYITELEALQLIDHLIESHPYLSNAHGRGGPGYKKTARWGINEGKNRPLML